MHIADAFFFEELSKMVGSKQSEIWLRKEANKKNSHRSCRANVDSHKGSLAKSKRRVFDFGSVAKNSSADVLFTGSREQACFENLETIIDHEEKHGLVGEDGTKWQGNTVNDMLGLLYTDAAYLLVKQTPKTNESFSMISSSSKTKGMQASVYDCTTQESYLVTERNNQ